MYACVCFGERVYVCVQAESGSLIRYIGIGRLSDGLICASHAQRGKASDLSEVVTRVISSGNFAAKSQLTVTINDAVGTLHLSSGEEEVAVARV